MTIYQRARIVFKQFMVNLNEDNWVYRHSADREPDLPKPFTESLPGVPVSSLSLALNHMGILRHSSEHPALDSNQR